MFDWRDYGNGIVAFDAGYVRPPQRDLTAQEKRALAEGMKEIGIL